jgi:hypothetical protein
VSNIGPKAQALVARLAQMDPRQPRVDRATADRAITAHLNALGLRRRPIIWLPDARTALRYVKDQARIGGFGASALNIADRTGVFVRFLLIVLGLTLLGSFAMWPLGFFVDWISGTRTGMVLRSHLGVPTLISVTTASAALGVLYSVLSWLVVRNFRIRRDIAAATETALNSHAKHWDAALREVVGPEMDQVPLAAHQEAIGEVIGPSLRCLTGSQACPMAEAFAAGLFLYWIRPGEVVCVAQPALRIAAGRLYSVQWPTGERYRFRRGIKLVPLEASA